MTESEVRDVLDHARRLWPAWKPDDADTDSWRRTLSRIHSPQLAMTALTHLKDTSDWNTPKRGQTLEILSRQVGGRSGDNRLHTGHPGMYIQCVSHPKPSMVGHFATLYWPTHEPMPDGYQLLTRMEQFRADNQALYGGDWQLVRSMHDPLDDHAMACRRAEIRHSEPWMVQDVAGKWVRRPSQQRAEDYRGTPIRQTVADFMQTVKPKHEPPPEPFKADEEPFE